MPGFLLVLMTDLFESASGLFGKTRSGLEHYSKKPRLRPDSSLFPSKTRPEMGFQGIRKGYPGKDFRYSHAEEAGFDFFGIFEEKMNF